MTTAIVGVGTAEAVWRPWLDSLACPELDLTQPPRAVSVAIAHPDDEVLGVGGLLRRLAAAGTDVRVVVATDGERSHPRSVTVTSGELAAMRRAEGRRALAALGVGPPLRLGRPDGAADQLQPAVAAALERRCTTAGTDDHWLLAVWSGDGHPDHEAVGRAAEQVAVQRGLRCLAFPVWAWHWAAPDDERLPWSRSLRVHLTEAERTDKARAIACHRSQVVPLSSAPGDEAILPPPVVARFTQPDELVWDIT